MESIMSIQTPTFFCRQNGWTNKTNEYSLVSPSVDYEVRRNPMTGRVISCRPYNLNFTCERRSDKIDKSMLKIYKNAIKGKVEMKPNPYNLVCHTFKGLCGNVRQFLHECRCGMLDRLIHPELREAFEKSTIEAIEKMKIGNNQSINIAMFASGGLLGEWVLMLKLIDHLDNKGFKGVINIFLIDQVYKDAITKAGNFTCGPKPCSFSWTKFLGDCHELNQFLTEIALVLPSKIKVTGSVFGEANEYIARAQADATFRHDIVIGADIEAIPSKTDKVISDIRRFASRRDVPGIVLDKILNTTTGRVEPMICQVDPTKQTYLSNCKPLQVAKN